MDFDYCLKQLADDVRRLCALAEDVGRQQARWKPDAETWSILEVICHLLEEEQKDFRVRLDFTLHRPGESWPAINPAGWVTEHAYNEQDLEKSLQLFLVERQVSLTWLQNLGDPDWEATYEAPWGLVSAGNLLAAWVAHDLLHMRQLVELLWAYNEQKMEPSSTRYAGEW